MSNISRVMAPVGPAHTKEMNFTSRLIEAEACKALGLLNELLPYV